MTSRIGVHRDTDKLLVTHEEAYPMLNAGLDVCQQGMGVTLNVRESQHRIYEHSNEGM